MTVAVRPAVLLVLGLLWSVLVTPGVRCEDSECNSIVRDLGHRRWESRERAQQSLIEIGVDAVPALLEATRSKNPEVSQRARYILDTIDPVTVRFRIVTLALEAPTRVIAVLDGAGTEGEEVELPSPRSGHHTAMNYFVKSRAVIGQRLELTAQKGRAGGSHRMSLRRPSSVPGSLSILERGTRTFHLHNGAHFRREEHHFVTLLLFERHRESGVKSAPNTSGHSPQPGLLSVQIDGLLPHLVATLRAQAANTGNTDPAIRRDAVEALGLLGDDGATGLMRDALRDRCCREQALLALGRVGDDEGIHALQELLDTPEDAREDNVSEPKRADFMMTEAALILAERDDARALIYLISKLGGSDPNVASRVFSTLSDHGALARNAVPTDTLLADALLEKLAEKATIDQISWTDPETVYHYHRAMALLDTTRPEHRVLATKLLDNLARRLAGKDPMSKMELRAFTDLWERISRFLPLIDEVESAVGPSSISIVPSDVLATFLINLRDHARIPEVCGWIARIHEFRPLPDGAFTRIHAAIDTELRKKAVGGESSAMGLLVHLSRNLSVSSGQITALVELILEALAGAHPSYRRDLLGELARLTGQEEMLRKSGVAILGARGVRNPKNRGKSSANDTRSRLLLKKLAPAAKAWMSNPAAIQASLLRLARDRPLSACPSESAAVEFVEMEVLTHTGRAPLEARHRPVKVLDGRVLRIPLSTPVAYRDRFGNLRTVRVDPSKLNVNPRSGKTATPARYRINDRVTVTANVPSLSLPHDRIQRTGWYVTTESQLGPYLENPGTGPRLKTLLIVRTLDEGGRGASQSLAETRGGEETWRYFVGRFRKSLPSMRASELRRAIRLIDELGMGDVLPDIRKLFAGRPSVYLASELLDMGEQEAPRAYLLETLRGSGTDAVKQRERVLAAQALTRHGNREGFRFLLGVLSGKTPRPRRGSHAILASLDTYLVEASPGLREKMDVLDLLIKNLHQPSYQTMAFRVLRREAGSDFGFTASRSAANQQERKARRRQAVEKAREWWSKARARKFAHEDPNRK